MAEPVVVDTNVLFSALLRRSARFTEALLTSDRRFLINELVVVELFKHKEKIVRLSRLGDEDVVHLFYELLRELELFKEELVAPANRAKAAELCQDVDLIDAPHVAIALETGELLWTGDQKLKQGLRAKGFTRFFEPPR
ncbi:MAG: PIN domain-containing protein [Bacteroidetes bacterium]|nr:PIN domain-containing protein [Bacteroidota bacterium]